MFNCVSTKPVVNLYYKKFWFFYYKKCLGIIKMLIVFYYNVSLK